MEPEEFLGRELNLPAKALNLAACACASTAGQPVASPVKAALVQPARFERKTAGYGRLAKLAGPADDTGHF